MLKGLAWAGTLKAHRCVEVDVHARKKTLNGDSHHWGAYYLCGQVASPMVRQPQLGLWGILFLWENRTVGAGNAGVGRWGK